jgi:hypothetical protein
MMTPDLMSARVAKPLSLRKMPWRWSVSVVRYRALSARRMNAATLSCNALSAGRLA